MDRRTFITTSSVGVVVAAAGVSTRRMPDSLAVEARSQQQGPQRKKLLLQLGSNANAYDEAEPHSHSAVWREKHRRRIQIADPARMRATPAEFAKLRELPDKHGIEVKVMTSFVPVQSILHGKSPERDHEIEAWQNMIKGAAAAGIPCIKYLMSILGNVRTGRDPGRADTSYTASDMAAVKEQSDRLGPIPGYGVVTRDMYGSALPTSSTVWCPSRTNTRSGSRIARMTP